MEVVLKEKPKNPIIIEGFPGFGLVGTIATEFLLEHLKMRNIGHIWLDELQPMVAVHNEKVVQPLGLFYNEKYNIVILHVVTAAQGMEWKLSDAILDIASQLKAKEIVSLEGVGSTSETDNPRTFFYSNNDKKRKELSRLGINPLKEGIIIGVTSALLLKTKLPMSCIFVETHSTLPDSKAAAKLIETLDHYLGLKIDYEPLLKSAEQFEEKLKALMSQTNDATELADKKRMSYVG